VAFSVNEPTAPDGCVIVPVFAVRSMVPFSPPSQSGSGKWKGVEVTASSANCHCELSGRVTVCSEPVPLL
jgi:hypothetical protein